MLFIYTVIVFQSQHINVVRCLDVTKNYSYFAF